jgi:hypothetical protein
LARKRNLFLAALAGMLVACGPAVEPGISRGASGADCIVLFEQYDVLDRMMSTTRRERWSVPPELMRQAEWLRDGGCITLTADLAGMEDVPVVQIADSGAAIAPTTLHVGVVTTTADDVAAIDYFRARGVRAFSIGKAGLGRRVYVGPLGTQGALEAARTMALDAGFAYPYPTRY